MERAQAIKAVRVAESHFDALWEVVTEILTEDDYGRLDLPKRAIDKLAKIYDKLGSLDDLMTDARLAAEGKD